MDAKLCLGEPRALISRTNLMHNARLLRQSVGSAKICAILKANAYGHGTDIVIDALSNFAIDDTEGPLIDALAVASIDEAAELPETPLPVIIFRPVENTFIGRQRGKLEAAIRAGWILTVCSPAAAGDVARVAMACGKRANVQIMIDTGMTRSGAHLQQVDELVAAIGKLPSLKLFGMATHFACSEDLTTDFTELQLGRFLKVTDAHAAAASAAGKPIIRHCANSAACFLHAPAHLDMVRPGLALYGIDPACKPVASRNLRPAMRWTAPILIIRDMKKGDGVGYGQTWHAPRDTRVGLVPVGYADGYLRAFSNKAVMMVHGKPAPVIGRVSMDLTTIDLTDIPQTACGDEATILDADPLSPASVYQLANIAGTIPYEIFCHIGHRVHRVAVEPAEHEIIEKVSHPQDTQSRPDKATDAA